eukprot:Amastigsp_a677010_243.p3 type:complete len:120 gc:universal Amastigsp_a677010_243:828-469(-)
MMRARRLTLPRKGLRRRRKRFTTRRRFTSSARVETLSLSAAPVTVPSGSARSSPSVRHAPWFRSALAATSSSRPTSSSGRAARCTRLTARSMDIRLTRGTRTTSSASARASKPRRRRSL